MYENWEYRMRIFIGMYERNDDVVMFMFFSSWRSALEMCCEAEI